MNRYEKSAATKRARIDALKAQIIKAYQAGKSFDEMALLFSVSGDTLSRRLRTWSVPLRPFITKVPRKVRVNLGRGRSGRLSIYIPRTDYEKILESQGGHCWFCPARTGFRSGKGRLQFDHDHKTLTLRKLLCNRHNALIAVIEEAPNQRELLEKVKEYLGL